jgi:hypothetical protein
MRKTIYIFYSISTLLILGTGFLSCNSNQKNDQIVLISLEEGMKSFIKNMEFRTSVNYAQLEENIHSRLTMEKALEWQHRAALLRQESFKSGKKLIR